MSTDSTNTRFDESLEVFLDALIGVLGQKLVESGWMLRDAVGRLAFVSGTSLSDEQREAASAAAQKRIPNYCRQGWSVLDGEQPGMAALIRRARCYTEIVPFRGGTIQIKLLDQRIVGQDWLNNPSPSQPSTAPRRYVFASIKGGVGRTTALCVAAAELARRGKKLLVIDLDLEAPGVGAILLPVELLPRFGLLDGYVESNIGGVDREFMLDMVSASPFGAGRGLIDVAPAVGVTSLNHPANVLAKIARAYLESSTQSGEAVGFLGHTQGLVDQLAATKHYDAIFIDARAGLNESTAAALLGLGAKVLLFGEDTPRTFSGYRYLLAHLARFPRDENDDWLTRFRMVHAKASADTNSQQIFRDKAYDLYRGLLYRNVLLDDRHSGDFEADAEDLTHWSMPEYSLDDPEAPHFAWPILRDSNYFEFDPLNAKSQLTPALYERTYQALIDNLVQDFDDLSISSGQ